MRNLALALVAVAFAGVALAQERDDVGSDARFKLDWVTEAMARDVLDFAIANITQAVDERGHKLRPLTPQEVAEPLLDIPLVMEIMDVARASAAGLSCGLDWQAENYLRLMKRERARGDRSVHQIAATSLVHGITLAQFDVGQECPPEQRARIKDFYGRKWQ